MNRASAIRCTCEWARLNPFPPSANHIEIEITGGMFTRGFDVTFKGDPKEIRKWLESSPGIKDHILNTRYRLPQHFEIDPGGGAQFAEIHITKDGRQIRIRTYWS